MRQHVIASNTTAEQAATTAAAPVAAAAHPPTMDIEGRSGGSGGVWKLCRVGWLQTTIHASLSAAPHHTISNTQAQNARTREHTLDPSFGQLVYTSVPFFLPYALSLSLCLSPPPWVVARGPMAKPMAVQIACSMFALQQNILHACPLASISGTICARASVIASVIRTSENARIFRTHAICRNCAPRSKKPQRT